MWSSTGPDRMQACAELARKSFPVAYARPVRVARQSAAVSATRPGSPLSRPVRRAG